MRPSTTKYSTPVTPMSAKNFFVAFQVKLALKVGAKLTLCKNAQNALVFHYAQKQN